MTNETYRISLKFTTDQNEYTESESEEITSQNPNIQACL